MRQTFGPILDILDEGLRLYRRGFSRFVLLAAIAAVPIGLAAAAVFVAYDWLATGVGLAVALIAFVGGTPLSLYVMGALSRAAAMAMLNQQVSLRQALAIGPLRILGMGCYGSLFLLVASTAVSLVSTACFCVAYMFIGAGMFAFTAGFAQAGSLGEAAAGIALGLSVIALLAVYAASLVVNGAVYGSTVYAVQPFVQDQLRLGATMRRSLDLIGYRMGENLLAFLSASLVFGAAALASTLAIGVLMPLPALFLLGGESPVARAITAAAWVAGVAVAAPLLPIWMALLYQRRRAARDGEDLAERIGAMTSVARDP
ncbi:MAG: hypothetical protein HGA45_43660 [Chloroflexales bacterium]|nr:hypothetical protein [Chloroflexales bacterium]